MSPLPFKHFHVCSAVFLANLSSVLIWCCSVLAVVLSPAPSIHLNDTQLLRHSDKHSWIHDWCSDQILTLLAKDSPVSFNRRIYLKGKLLAQIYSAIPRGNVTAFWRLKLKEKGNKMNEHLLAEFKKGKKNSYFVPTNTC